MNNYEVLYIIVAGLDEAAYGACIDKYKDLVTAHGGEVASVDKWGMRRLAYPINYKSEGYYVVMNFSAKPDFPLEMERIMRISDDVIRFITIVKN